MLLSVIMDDEPSIYAIIYNSTQSIVSLRINAHGRIAVNESTTRTLL